MMDMNAIEVKHLTMIYKDGKKALDDCNLHVKQGEVFALLGENGAGKSSLIHILTTYLQPTSGDVTMMGLSLKEHADAVRSQIGCVAQTSSFDDYLTLEENLNMQASLYSMKKKDSEKRIKKLMHIFQLEAYRKKDLRHVSGGIKRKIDIAMSMMMEPAILFLDEPTAGLDIIARNMLWETIKMLREEFHTTIFLTTHYLEEAQKLSDTICFLKDGHVQVQASLKQLQEDMAHNWVEIRLQDHHQIQAAQQLLASQPFSIRTQLSQGCVSVQMQSERQDLHEVFACLMKEHIRVQGIGFVEPTLDDIFIKFTQAKGVL